MKTLDYVVMVAFLLAICVMGGVLKTRRTRTRGSADDHLLAGGHIPYWAAAISYVMGGCSARIRSSPRPARPTTTAFANTSSNGSAPSPACCSSSSSCGSTLR